MASAKRSTARVHFSTNGRRIHYALQLQTLERVHGNSYELLLYLASEFVGAAVGMFRLGALYIIVTGMACEVLSVR